MRSWFRYSAVLVFGVLACSEDVTAPGDGTGIIINVVSQRALDSGFIRVVGPTARVLKVTPGSTTNIDDLQAGTYTVALQGYAGGLMDQFFEQSGVQVRSGNRTVLTPTLSAFVGTVTAPTGPPCTGTVAVNYSLVVGAAAYRVQMTTALDSAFASAAVRSVDRSAGQSSADFTGTTAGTYLTRMRASDPYGGVGRWSALQTVNVVPATGSTTFNFTGGAQTFTVPLCVTSVTIDAMGAQGGSGSQTGGLGGRAIGTRAVTGGSTLTVRVGGVGLNVGTAGNASGFAGGFNGGGAVREYTTWGGQTEGASGTGGGASDVRSGGNALANRIIVAGGGGGAGNTAGGAGGGTSGQTAASGTLNTVGGGGGTQTAGGTAAQCCLPAYPNEPGALGVGGAAYRDAAASGGGGGGYYGGGGGQFAGGGGGSSFIGGLTGASTTVGVRAGNGVVSITW